MNHPTTVTPQRQEQVSEAALIARINRKLKHQDEMLRTARRYWADGHFLEHPDLGRYFVVDLFRNLVIQTHVDLEELGREVGALREFEQVASEE